MEQKKQTHIAYGFVAGILMVVIALVLYLTHMMLNPVMAYLVQLPFLVAVIMNAIAYSKANDGFVTFGNVFGSGFKLSMIVAIVMVAWTILCFYVFPEMKAQELVYAREKMLSDPNTKNLPDDQLEMSLNFVKKGWTAIKIGTAILGSLFFGAIFSLIGAAIAQKKGERPVTSEF